MGKNIEEIYDEIFQLLVCRIVGKVTEEESSLNSRNDYMELQFKSEK